MLTSVAAHVRCYFSCGAQRIKEAEAGVKEVAKRVNDIAGVKESDTGLAPPSRWDLVSDKQAMQEEQPLQVRAVIALTVPRHPAVGAARQGGWTHRACFSLKLVPACTVQLEDVCRANKPLISR